MIDKSNAMFDLNYTVKYDGRTLKNMYLDLGESLPYLFSQSQRDYDQLRSDLHFPENERI